MNKYKVYVYAICKNEEKFVNRWVKSMSEADKIFVLDTGSSDNTVKLLEDLGVAVKTQEIKPWRFDVARNKSLDLVPNDADICVCTDLDEIFHSGWREALEKAWNHSAKRVRYRYTWNFNPDGSEGTVFYIDKIHSKKDYCWINPVHEVLKWCGEANEPQIVLAEGIQLDHFADDTKPRSQYLPLLELAVSEDPQNDRNMHYLGREYMFYGKWDKCIETLKRHLSLKTAVWKDERSASMRFIARSYINLKKLDEAQNWCLRAIAEAPHLREPYLEYASLALLISDWELVVWLTKKALNITERPKTYITEAASWGSLPYDLGSIGHYHLGNFKKSLDFIDKAIALSPNDERLKSNRELILKKL